MSKVYRDAAGRLIGREYTDQYGNKTFKDMNGGVTAREDYRGTTNFGGGIISRERGAGASSLPWGSHGNSGSSGSRRPSVTNGFSRAASFPQPNTLDADNGYIPSYGPTMDPEVSFSILTGLPFALLVLYFLLHLLVFGFDVLNYVLPYPIGSGPTHFWPFTSIWPFLWTRNLLHMDACLVSLGHLPFCH